LGFGRESERENAGDKNFFFPCLYAFRGRRKLIVPFKTKPFWAFPFLFLTVDETTLFWTKHVVSFKRKWRKKCAKVQISPQFVMCSIKS
jgi:hypothetical protein